MHSLEAAILSLANPSSQPKIIFAVEEENKELNTKM